MYEVSDLRMYNDDKYKSQLSNEVFWEQWLV